MMAKDEGLPESLLGKSFQNEQEELDALKAAPWSDALKPFIQTALERGKVFTHSNRLSDARVTTTIAAPYAAHGDVSACAAGLSDLVDQQGDAKESPKFKRIFAAYTLDGVTTHLAEALMQGRPAGCYLTDKASHWTTVTRGTHALDKVVLMPCGDEREYLALLPKTPSYLYPALLAAAKAVGYRHVHAELEALAEKQDLKAADLPKTLAVRLRARCNKLSKAQNFSFQLNRIAGQIIQPLFLPPSLGISQPRRLAFLAKRWTEEGRLPIGLLSPVFREALNVSGFHAAIAHERHRHELDAGEVINNHGVREAYRLLGHVVGNMLRDTLAKVPLTEEGREVAAQRDAMLDALGSNQPGWYNDVENRLFLLIPEAYRLEGGRALFRKGFFGRDEAPLEARQAATVRRFSSGSTRAEEGRLLVIHLKATDVDVGSNGISIGVPAMTAIHGLLHQFVERGEGLRIKRFLPAFSRIELNDTLARHGTSRVALWDKDIKNVLAGDLVLTPALLSLGMGPSAMNGRSAVSVKAADKGKAVTPPFNNDIKASVDMSLVVELRGGIDAQAGNELVERLQLALAGARLAGGPINWARCNVREEAPRLRGFALERVELDPDENPLEALFRSVAFAERRYLGEFPMGAVHTGYEALADAGIVHRRGKPWEARHVESLYSLFRFVRAEDQERQWFRLKILSPDNTIFTLC